MSRNAIVRRLVLALSIGLAAPIALAPRLAAQSDVDLAARLDSVRDRRDLDTVRRSLEESGISPTALAEALRAQGDAPAVRERDFKIELEDGRGHPFAVRVLVPEDYDPARACGLLLALHGMGADEDDLAPTFRPATERGWVVALPSCTEPVAVDDPREALFNVFTRGIWWDHGSRGSVLATLDEMRRRFHVDEDRIALSGFSMGGFAAWAIGLRHHARFAAIAPIGGAISRLEVLKVADTHARRLLENALGLGVFILHGAADDVIPPRPDEESHELLSDLGYPHEFHLVEGARHMVPFLRGKGPEYDAFWRWLDTTRREALPERIVHVALALDHGAGQWVEVLEAARFPVKIEARVLERDRIAIDAPRGTRLVVYLHPELVDVEAEIQVDVEGRPLTKTRVSPRLDCVLSSWWAYRGDRRRITPYALELDIP